MQWRMTRHDWATEVGTFHAHITKHGPPNHKWASLTFSGVVLGTLELDWPGRTALDIQVWANDLIESALREALDDLNSPHD